MATLKVACVQVNASNDMRQNIQTACDMLRDARTQGAELICLPENVAMMEFGGENVIAKSFPQDEHPALIEFKAVSAEIKAWTLVGSIAVRLENNKVANRCFLLNPDGEIAGQYDKIHLFDVDLDGGESYRESNTFDAGETAVLANTPWGGLGMTICYDVRFPHLFRTLAKAGANIITVPAAFTKPTGLAHWKVLLRARAIETGCYVIAPAQCGSHKGGRETYGHSLIISPWGDVLSEGGDIPEILTADLNIDEVADVRQKVPALQHDRLFDFKNY